MTILSRAKIRSNLGNISVLDPKIHLHRALQTAGHHQQSHLVAVLTLCGLGSPVLMIGKVLRNGNQVSMIGNQATPMLIKARFIGLQLTQNRIARLSPRQTQITSN